VFEGLSGSPKSAGKQERKKGPTINETTGYGIPGKQVGIEVGNHGWSRKSETQGVERRKWTKPRKGKKVEYKNGEIDASRGRPCRRGIVPD